MKFALYSVAIVAVTIPSMTEAVPINAMAEADGQDSWYGNLKRSVTPLATYCARKLGVEAEAAVAKAVEGTAFMVGQCALCPDEDIANYKALTTHAAYLQKQ